MLLMAGHGSAEPADEFWSFMSEEAANLTVASPTPESVFDSVSNVKVIGRAEIERYNFGSVAEALQTVPGISVTRTYLMHNIPTVRGALQEHYANKVLVMINNVPMWNAVTGEGDLDRVEIDSVERIEVLLGPASVLYGSNALTGAINIVLRESARPGGGHFTGGLGSGAGGYGGRSALSRGGGLYSRKKDGLSYTVSAGSRDESQPSTLFSDENRDVISLREYLRTRSLNLSARKGGTSFLFNAAGSDQNYLGNGLDLASGALFNETKEMALASFSHVLDPGWGSVALSAAYDWQRRNIPRDAADDVRSDITGSRLTGSASAVIPMSGGFSLEAGAAGEYRGVTRYLNYNSDTGVPLDDNSMSGRSTRENSAHAQAGYEKGRWKLLLGGRYTRNSQAGSNVSSRASAIYKFSSHKSLKAMFSQSFRSPTAFEQYFKPSPVTVLGNPDLKPEKTGTWEVSYLESRGRLFAHLTLYASRHKDAIFRNYGTFTRDGVTATNNFYDNAPEFTSEGVELFMRYDGRRAGAFLSFEASSGSRDDAHPVSPPDPNTFGLPGGTSWNYRYVPSYTVSGGLTGDIGDFFAAANFNAFARTRSLREEIGAQFWADLSLGWRSGGARHALAVRNVTDRVVEVPEYVRLQVVERLPLYTGRRLEYTFSYRF